MRIFEIKEGSHMKAKTAKNTGLFKTHKSYGVEEILAAGGTTAFGIKMGKDMDSMLKAMENAPKPEPFTDEEWADLMDQLAKDK
jgi:hypothetical protein